MTAAFRGLCRVAGSRPQPFDAYGSTDRLMTTSPHTDPATWVDRHGDALYRYALLQTRDEELAEECVQEAFVAALQSRASFRGQCSERTWLIGILKHKICDHFRRRSRTLPADEAGAAEKVAAMFTDDGIWKDLPRAWTSEPHGETARDELLEALRACMAKLPQRMADLFCLRELHGLNTPTICQILGLSPTNLWVQLHRARALLRRCLERAWSVRGGR